MPRSNLLSRFVLEDPLLLCGLLVLTGIVMVYLALGRDNRRLLKGGFGTLVAALVIYALGSFITTTAEETRDATKAFILAAEEGRINDMLVTLAPDATMHFGRPGNPGQPFAAVERDLRLLGSRHRIKANSTSSLTSGADTSDHAITTFRCRTTTESSYGPVSSSWSLEWQRDPKGQWRILRITAIRIAGKTPRGSLFR